MISSVDPKLGAIFSPRRQEIESANRDIRSKWEDDDNEDDDKDSIRMTGTSTQNALQIHIDISFCSQKYLNLQIHHGPVQSKGPCLSSHLDGSQVLNKYFWKFSMEKYPEFQKNFFKKSPVMPI